MTMAEIIQKIRSVSYALENVEVKGHNNMDALLGSIQALDRVASELVKIQKAQPQPDITIVPAEDENTPG